MKIPNLVELFPPFLMLQYEVVLQPRLLEYHQNWSKNENPKPCGIVPTIPRYNRSDTDQTQLEVPIV